MAGDWEEHATLLCNFFNHIFKVQNKESSMAAYLVVGRGIPEVALTLTLDPTPYLVVGYHAL